MPHAVPYVHGFGYDGGPVLLGYVAGIHGLDLVSVPVVYPAFDSVDERFILGCGEDDIII